jgi:hypothetical protein
LAVDEHISVRQNPGSPSILDDIVEYLPQVIMLEHEPFSDEPSRGLAYTGRLRGSIKAAKRKNTHIWMKTWIHVVEEFKQPLGIYIYRSGFTSYCGYFSARRRDSCRRLVLWLQQMYLPDEASFSARNTSARQRSSTWLIGNEPVNDCRPFRISSCASSPSFS